MAKIRLTKAMKDYIKEELMSPVTEWYAKEYARIKEEQEEDFKNLFMVSNEYANQLVDSMSDLGYEVQNVETLKSQLRKDIRYLCNSRRIKTREDKSLLQLKEKFEERTQKVDKILVQIELECALGTDKAEFMSLLNDYKEKIVRGL